MCNTPASMYVVMKMMPVRNSLVFYALIQLFTITHTIFEGHSVFFREIPTRPINPSEYCQRTVTHGMPTLHSLQDMTYRHHRWHVNLHQSKWTVAGELDVLAHTPTGGERPETQRSPPGRPGPTPSQSLRRHARPPRWCRVWASREWHGMFSFLSSFTLTSPYSTLVLTSTFRCMVHQRSSGEWLTQHPTYGHWDAFSCI